MRVRETYFSAAVGTLLALGYAAIVAFAVPGARSPYSTLYLALVLFCINGVGFGLAALTPLSPRYASVKVGNETAGLSAPDWPMLPKLGRAPTFPERLEGNPGGRVGVPAEVRELARRQRLGTGDQAGAVKRMSAAHRAKAAQFAANVVPIRRSAIRVPTPSLDSSTPAGSPPREAAGGPMFRCAKS